MFKKCLAAILAVAMVAAMWIIPASAADVVLDVDYGDKAWKGESTVISDTLPIPQGYSGNFTLELYVKINDFATPSVIAGAFPDGGGTPYAIWVNGGNLFFSAGDTNGNNHVIMGSAYTDNWAGKWIHIIGAKNGTTNKLYVSPEGSSDYATESAARTYATVWSDATAFKVNCASTLFDGAGDFSLGTIRMYNDDVSANRAAMKAECAARLDAAHPTEAPTEEPTPEPTPEPTEDPRRAGDIILESKPSKMFYEVGEELDLTGISVATKIDGVKTPIDIADCEITGFDSSKVGEVKITIKYGTEDVIFSNSFTLRIVPKQPEGVTAIGLATKPTKLYYEVGEELDTTGLSILAKYADGTTAYITEGLEVSGYDPAVTGNQRLTVSYEGCTTSFTVSTKSVIGIGLETKPAKLSYAYGEKLDTTGLTILAKYSDGTIVRSISEGVTVTGYEARVSGPQVLTVAYEGCTTSFTVEVAEKPEGLENPLEDAKFFTATTPKVSCTDSITLPDSFTIEVKGSGAVGYLMWGGRYQVQVLSSGAVQAWNFYKSALAMTSPKTYDVNDEIHVVLVGEGNTLSMYVNGELAKTSQADDLVVPGEFNITSKCIFGDQSASGVEVNFYSQAATAAEVAAMYSAY